MNAFAPVFIEDHEFSKLKEWLAAAPDISTIVFLLDENTHQHCLPLVMQAINFSQRTEIIELSPGESQKNLDICAQLWGALSEWNADRNTLIINLGGGVICDMGGFIAGTYKRGIRFLNIPTTLLAMVDAAHGGKTGIDFEGYKNQIGLFYPPEASFVYPAFCQSLPEREFIAGFAECVKHALIADKELWLSFLMNGKPDPDLIENYIEPSVLIKKTIVESDPTEKGPRKMLNFGHTIGHAIESFSLQNDQDPLLHGEAVAMGMLAELYISTLHCGLDQAQLHIAADFLRSVFPMRKLPEIHFNTLIQLMQQDKKNADGKISFTLIPEPGSAVIDFHAPELSIIESLAFVNQFFVNKS